MGIYVFNTRYLLKMLAENREETDFGMHMIPKAVGRDQIFAYPFHGYWRDVGTIQAYWEASMSFGRDDDPAISAETWGIRSNPEEEGRTADRCPTMFVSGSKVASSMISAGCIIEGEVFNSVLSPGVRVGPGAVVRDSILFHDCVIEKDAVVDLAILDKQVRIGRGAFIGSGEQKDVSNKLYPSHLYTGISLVGKRAVVPEKMVVGRNCIIQPGCTEGDFTGLIVETGETV